MNEIAGSAALPAIETLGDPAGSGLIWASLDRAGGSESADLAPTLARFGLHPSTLVALHERRLLPLLSGASDPLLAVLIAPSAARSPDRAFASVGLAVGVDFVLTFASGATTLTRLFRECEADPARRASAFRDGPAGLAATIVGEVVAQAARAAAALGQRIADSTAPSLDAPVGDPREFAALRRDAELLVGVLVANREVVANLWARLRGGENGERAAALWETSILRLDEAVLTVHGATVSLEAALAARSVAESARVVRATRAGAAIAGLTLPPILGVLLAGLGGAATTPTAFDVLLGGIVAYVAVGLFLFRRRDWL